MKKKTTSKSPQAVPTTKRGDTYRLNVETKKPKKKK